MSNQVGLVLSGGGAKGAYHLGAMKAIQEMNISIDRISGASIGALNGAILASAKNLDEGISHMEDVWHSLTQQNPIQFKTNGIKPSLPSIKQSIGYISFLLSSGLRLTNPLGIMHNLSQCLKIEHVCDDRVLQKMMQEYLNLEQLQHSLPLYVSIFPQYHVNSAIDDFLGGIKDAFQTGILGIENHLSEFRHIQSLPLEQQKETILASAALPLLFKAYESENSSRFTDGGQGGMIKSQGNTPIQPLIDSGCKHIIVVHLDGTSLWHRHDFPDVEIIEIRPSIDMGGFFEMLDFSKPSIQMLIDTGYRDAKLALSQVKESLEHLNAMRQSTQQLKQVFNTAPSATLESAMNRLHDSK